jgi:hypothetical protein
MAWALDVKKVDAEALAKWEERDLFKEFVEDFNTGTLPHQCVWGGGRGALLATLAAAAAIRPPTSTTAPARLNHPTHPHPRPHYPRKYYDLAAYEMAQAKKEADRAAAKAAAKAGTRKAAELNDEQELHRRRVEEQKREQEKRIRDAMEALRWGRWHLHGGWGGGRDEEGGAMLPPRLGGRDEAPLLFRCRP